MSYPRPMDIYILCADDDEEVETDRDSFFRDNDNLDPEVVETITALQIGEEYRDGGGASVPWSVRRVA